MPSQQLLLNPKKTVRASQIALPNEHGSWSFLFEPLVAAVVAAPSVAAVWIFLLFFGAFLARRPMKILLSDLRARRRLPRTPVAFKFAAIYAAISGSGLAGTVFFGNSLVLLPLLLVVPLGIFQVYCDVYGRSRALLPELTGAVAISSSSAVIALAGGWAPEAAAALWGIFIARLIPSIVYVRNRLRAEKGKDFSPIPVIILHCAALGVFGIISDNGPGSKLTVAVFVLLLARAAFGLSPLRRKSKAMKIGILETVYGGLMVLSVIIGYYFHI